MGLVMKSGQLFLDEYPEFQNGALIEPKIFQNLSGENIAYMFNAERKGILLGFIIVGNSKYGYNVLDTVSPFLLSIPSILEVKTQITSDLQISIEEKDVRNPRLVYLGYGSYYAIYTINGNSIALSLTDKHDFYSIEPTPNGSFFGECSLCVLALLCSKGLFHL